MHNTLAKMKALRLLLAAAQFVAALGNATLASVQPQALEAVYGVPDAALAAGSPITGRAFQDYNANGLYDTTGVSPTLAIDRGVAGITVTAYISGSLTPVGVATTTASGLYTLTTTDAGTGPYRLEFTGIPASFFVTGMSAQNGSTVQFVSAGASAVNLAVNVPNEYCQNNPGLASICFVQPALGSVSTRSGTESGARASRTTPWWATRSWARRRSASRKPW